MSAAQERPAPDLALEQEQLVARALEEDLGNLDLASDLTTRWTVPAAATSEARIVAKARGIVSGLDVAASVFRSLEVCRSLMKELSPLQHRLCFREASLLRQR